MILKEEKYLKTLFQSSLMFPACTVFIRSELFVWCNIRVAAAAAAACWIIHCVLRKVACLLILKSKWELMEWQAAELKEQSSRISVPQVCVCVCVCVSEGRNQTFVLLCRPSLYLIQMWAAVDHFAQTFLCGRPIVLHPSLIFFWLSFRLSVFDTFP